MSLEAQRLVFVAQSCLTPQPHGLKPARLFCPWDFPGKNIGVGCHYPSPGDLPNPGIQSGPPSLQVDSLPPELSVKRGHYNSEVRDERGLRYLREKTVSGA